MGLGERVKGGKAADIKHQKVLSFLKALRKEVPWEAINSYGLFLILKTVFTSSEAWVNPAGETIIRIGNHYYDFAGEAHPVNHRPESSTPL